jgi:hydroxypyruvate isomerase
MTWALRYASHLGYRSPHTPLFRECVGSDDPVAHVEFAASLGLAGVQYALAVTRPADEVARVARALSEHSLEAGCLVYAPREILAQPLWGSSESGARDLIYRHLTRSFAVAQELGARRIAVLSGADPSRPRSLQRAALIENLRWAAEKAERANVVLCLENLSRRSLSGMLLEHIAEAYAAVKAVASPAVRLIFDTSHVQIMDGDVLENLATTWPAVEVIQLADNPGRAEPGSGELNFANILRAIQLRGYGGLVELEHGWTRPGRDTELNAIEYLRRIDGALGRIDEDTRTK